MRSRPSRNRLDGGTPRSVSSQRSPDATVKLPVRPQAETATGFSPSMVSTTNDATSHFSEIPSCSASERKRSYSSGAKVTVTSDGAFMSSTFPEKSLDQRGSQANAAQLRPLRERRLKHAIVAPNFARSREKRADRPLVHQAIGSESRRRSRSITASGVSVTGRRVWTIPVMPGRS